MHCSTSCTPRISGFITKQFPPLFIRCFRRLWHASMYLENCSVGWHQTPVEVLPLAYRHKYKTWQETSDQRRAVEEYCKKQISTPLVTQTYTIKPHLWCPVVQHKPSSINELWTTQRMSSNSGIINWFEWELKIFRIGYGNLTNVFIFPTTNEKS